MTPDAWYSLLLRFYPPAFRRRYGAAMIEAFSDCRRASTRSPLRFWLFIVIDTVRSAAGQYVEASRAGLRRPMARWVLACVFGSLLCEVAGSVLTWSFGYFYHPYLEGVRFAPWMYGVLLGAGLGSIQRLVLRGVSPAAWIAVSAASAALGLEFAITTASVIGPIGYGIVVGAVVAAGQWLVLREHVRRASWLVAGSALALGAASISGVVTVKQALAGLNPLGSNPHAAVSSEGLAVLMRGLSAPMNSTEWAFALATITITGAVVGAMTANGAASRVSRLIGGQHGH
jgi:hypothetical protein